MLLLLLNSRVIVQGQRRRFTAAVAATATEVDPSNTSPSIFCLLSSFGRYVLELTCVGRK